MKHIILIAVIIAATTTVAYSQHTSVEYNNGINIVKLSSGNNLNRIIPVSSVNETVLNEQKEISEQINDNSNSFNWVLKFTAGQVFKDVSFANTQVGFIVTELGSVYKSINGGNNWVSVMNLGFPYYWYGVHAISVDTVVIAGFNDQAPINNGVIRWSSDGGTTWTTDIVLQRPTAGVGWLDHVHFFNQNTGVVINGLSGGCYYTTTGGKTAGAWTFVDINSDGAWVSGNYDWQPGGTIYAAGIHFDKTTNFGVSWVSSPSADNVFDGGVDFLDQNNLFGWTGGGQISAPVSGWTHETTNGGSTWGPRQNTFAYPIRAVKFFDQNTGFAIGGNVQSSIGGIFSTSNGGANWNEDVNSGAEMFSFDVKVISADSMDVWCVGSTGGSFTGKLYKARMQNLVGIEHVGNEIPNGFALFQNYPNPFNPSTNIKYQIIKNSHVELMVYDINGKGIEVLVNKYQSTGTYNVNFDGTNLASGIYFYKLETDNFSSIKKMILLK